MENFFWTLYTFGGTAYLIYSVAGIFMCKSLSLDANASIECVQISKYALKIAIEWLRSGQIIGIGLSIIPIARGLFKLIIRRNIQTDEKTVVFE
ncbi:MAG: hypothetical protein AAB508_02795 [Patescibacteria group bacterium]